MSNVKRRGFGSMDKERLREVSRAAGQKAQATGRAHRWTRGTGGSAEAAAFKAARVKRERKALDALTRSAQELGIHDGD